MRSTDGSGNQRLRWGERASWRQIERSSKSGKPLRVDALRSRHLLRVKVRMTADAENRGRIIETCLKLFNLRALRIGIVQVMYEHCWGDDVIRDASLIAFCMDTVVERRG